MDRKRLQSILQRIADRTLTVEQGLESLRTFPLENIQFARIDHHRALRQGIPEVIYAPGKTDKQIISIAQRILKAGCDTLVTRLPRPIYKIIKKQIPPLRYYPDARLALALSGRKKSPAIRTEKSVLVCCAGTSDIPVAEEAALTAWIMGCPVERLYDVGVAGIHRLFESRHSLDKASVIVVVAGMEGALPSVIGGMVRKPLIAVPTSIGYGTSFEGLAALLAMLNSCAAGITVVNIDNGFGAGVAAATIALAMKEQKS